tara:strand:+ start:34 stop:294 length:261 start_codon:yes stop_codon:yes gene_type:complete
MKNFIYKTAIITIIFAITFEILIGRRVNDFKKQIYEITSKSNRDGMIIKIKEEIKKANKKENILDQEEKELLSIFIKKLISELNLR